MIFISAQPDEYYFLWQLELQIFNFKNLNIDLNNVHILIGYHEEKQLSLDFQAFKKKYKKLKIYAYPDTRENKNYLSSLRPHILTKHFELFPWLSNEVFFYHDSDIIFSRLPDFNSLIKGDTWYVSDTRAYLDSNYILETAGEKLFLEMCNIVGIAPQTVKENDSHAGGAQYVIKNPTAHFWSKLELDCEKIYDLLSDAEKKLNREGFEEKPFIQKWCTDMWAIWWNALLYNKKFEIHHEMRFCWANSPIAEWHNTNILHYTGSSKLQNGATFRKGDYLLYAPFHEKFDTIAKDNCSYPLVQMIRSFARENLVKKINLKDVSFLIPIKIDSPDRLKNIYASTSFLSKNFKTNIIVMEVDQTQKIDPKDLPEAVVYIFKKTDNPRLFRTQVNNEMIKMSNSKFIALYDADVIIPVKQMNKAVKILREGHHKIVSPYDGSFLNMDLLLKEMFLKFQDDAFLEVNKYKGGASSKRSFGGCILLDKAAYIAAGMENENLTSWGPDDIERVKRMQILGHKTIRLKGNLFHLHHERKTDSKYNNMTDYENLMMEYLHVSGLNKNELLNHIENWEWTKN
ncbi:hypothetical protein QG516_22020 [Pedobacter gandavensis]|uniref:galactosyltransferase-related protein n=1 Tax=Pedobacter TaxID=84567 RepID=UPI001C99E2D8|nr:MULTISPECIES: galactosyltransferase-related protein [Pedobacter]WGQ09194.1 hypothetical protein QG516_22020 [Pedobacter gandavensis]